MNVKQASARLEVSQATVYSLVAAGKIRCYRIGSGRGCIRITEEHLAEFLDRAEPKPAQVPAPSARPCLKHLHLA